MKTGLLCAWLVLACGFGHAEAPPYPSLEPLCGAQAFAKMIDRLVGKNGGYVRTWGGNILLPWSGKSVSYGVVLDAAALVPVEAIDEKDLATALASDNAYWRGISMGVILGHTKQTLPKTYSYADAPNRPATEQEIALLLQGFRK